LEEFLIDFDMPDIDLDGFDTENEGQHIKNRYILPRPFSSVPSYRVKYDNAEKMAKELGPEILAGHGINALLSGNFIFGDFLEAFAVTQNLLIDEMQMSTLSISKDNVDSLHNLLSGDYIRKLDLIVSDYFWSHNRQNAPYIYKHLDIDGKFQFAVAGTHTKICLMRAGGKKIVISGSANLRSSRCVEEVRIETNEEVFDFHYEWQSKIIEQYGTIKKSIRASALFDMITKGVEDKKTWLQECT
jgi:hypothetical protein